MKLNQLVDGTFARDLEKTAVDGELTEEELAEIGGARIRLIGGPIISPFLYEPMRSVMIKQAQDTLKPYQQIISAFSRCLNRC